MPTEISKSPLKLLNPYAGMLLGAGANMVKGHRERKAKFEAENPNQEYSFNLKASLGDALIGAAGQQLSTAPLVTQNQTMDNKQPFSVPTSTPKESFGGPPPTPFNPMTGSGIGSLMGGFNPNVGFNQGGLNAYSYLYGPSRSSAFRKTGSPLAYNMSATQAALEDKFSNVNRGITVNNPSDTSKVDKDKYANVYNKIMSQVMSSGNFNKFITTQTNIPTEILKAPEDKYTPSSTSWMDMFDRGTVTGTSSNTVDKGNNKGTIQLMPDNSGNRSFDPNMMIQYFKTKQP